MKILGGIRTVFNDNLAVLIKKYLDEQVAQNKIQWANSYNQILDDMGQKLISGINLSSIPYGSKINKNIILKEMDMVRIYLAALELESKNIDNILGTHELLRKDNVRTFTDIKRRYLDIVNHSIQEFKTTGIEIKDGRISLFPSLVQNFEVKDIDTIYTPDTYIKRIGNDPTPTNILPGTDDGYWETSIYTASQSPVKAIITLDYKDTISFNRLHINGAGRFPMTLKDVEVENGGTFVSIHDTDITSKFITVTYSSIYQTTKIRLTLQQNIGEFTWWIKLNNKLDILRENTREDALDVSTKRSINRNEYIPIAEDKVYNVYNYTMGAFNIQSSLYIFSGSNEGKFYSRKYTSNDPIETVKLSNDLNEYKPGSSTITYNLIQQDGSKISLLPGNELILTKTFSSTQTLTNGIDNWIELRSAPLRDNIFVGVNGQLATRVEQFSGNNTLEYIINGKKLFFSKPIQNKSVTASYTHRTNFFIIEILMSNGTNEDQFVSPYSENFSVIINKQE